MKMKNKNRFVGTLGVLGILIIVLCSLVSAFGAYIPYDTKTIPLIIAPGETKDFKITLGISPTEDGITLKTEVIKGGEIATLTDKNLEDSLTTESRSADVNVRVSIPQDAVDGTEYTITYRFSEVAPTGGGTVSFGSSSEMSMKVLVQKPVTPTPTPTETPAEEEIGVGWIILGIIIIIAVIIIIYYIIKSRKR